MKETALQFTLREMRELVSSPRAWGIMGVVVLILGISGPFQTFEYLAFGPRLAYWAIMGVASYGVGSFFGAWSARVAELRQFGPIAKYLFTGLGSGIPVAICVVSLNILALGDVFSDLQGLLMLVGYCIGISLAIVGLFTIFGHSNTQSSTQSNSVQTARILSRLPVEKRGKLISMSVQDHYVEVITSRGKHLTLVRLGDAMGETEGVPGLQIHRSHWIAIDAIKSVNRENGKVSILTNQGARVPVSRTYIKSLKEAGLMV